jgi:hypothetical protein
VYKQEKLVREQRIVPLCATDGDLIRKAQLIDWGLS